jgi:hypothetical protein
MDDNILASYGRCPDFLTALHQAEDRPQTMTEAEVMTTARVAMIFCGGNFAQARARRGTRPYRPTRRSRGRFHRRLPLMQELLVTRFQDLGESWKARKVDSVDVMDRFPVARGDHDRMPRAKLSQPEV